MKTISIRELHLKTGRWVRHAAVRGPFIVTDRGRRVAALQPFDARFGVTSALLEKARTYVLHLPSKVFVRSGDAVHLACAGEHGFREVYTNDRHMLQAARHFDMIGVNVLGE